jgi:hypothetical protein
MKGKGRMGWVALVSILFHFSSAGAAEIDTSAVGQLRHQSEALDSLVRSPAVKGFLRATRALPRIADRTVFFDSSRTHFYGEAEAGVLPESTRSKLISRVLDESFYYNTRYGTPLAYARPLDLVVPGIRSFAGLRLLDFGYGGIGHLRLLASQGADVVGVEVDPLLPVLYAAPGDQGKIEGVEGAPAGSLRLVHGRFPAEPEAIASVGEDYDLFVSKNVLKRGYLHPSRPADPRLLVQLGVDDTTFLRAVYRILRPGATAIVYNLSPAPSRPDEVYKPWSDGHDPFPRSLWESVGFEVEAYDHEDTEFARRMGHALEWDQGPGAMDLDHDLFGHYTLARKPRAARPSKGR